jgi:hypothetical protein
MNRLPGLECNSGKGVCCRIAKPCILSAGQLAADLL